MDDNFNLLIPLITFSVVEISCIFHTHFILQVPVDTIQSFTEQIQVSTDTIQNFTEQIQTSTEQINTFTEPAIWSPLKVFAVHIVGFILISWLCPQIDTDWLLTAFTIGPLLAGTIHNELAQNIWPIVSTGVEIILNDSSPYKEYHCLLPPSAPISIKAGISSSHLGYFYGSFGFDFSIGFQERIPSAVIHLPRYICTEYVSGHGSEYEDVYSYYLPGYGLIYKPLLPYSSEYNLYNIEPPKYMRKIIDYYPPSQPAYCVTYSARSLINDQHRMMLGGQISASPIDRELINCQFSTFLGATVKPKCIDIITATTYEVNLNGWFINDIESKFNARLYVSLKSHILPVTKYIYIR